MTFGFWLLLTSLTASALVHEWGEELRGALTCRTNGATHPQLWVFEQWHFAPGLDTHGQKELPQQENQTAIYRQLEKWISEMPASEQALIFAEGCEGEIDEHSSTRFNGWNLQELKGKSSGELAMIPTHVPLRLESRFSEHVRTLCVDDSKQVRAGLLAFSDARGVIGFMDRIQRFAQDPRRVGPYLQDVRRLYHLPESTNSVQVLRRLKQELAAIVERIELSIRERNAHMVRVIQKAIVDDQKRKNQAPFAALVIGGAHLNDLVRKLDEAGLSCRVIRPKGYRDDSEVLLSQLKQAVAGIQLH